MSKDYYQILNLNRDCTERDISQQYRKLALQWHPLKSKQPKDVAQSEFASISEAYVVLSDLIKRAYYDKYGYLKLIESLSTAGGIEQGYRFASNPDQIYQRFFGQSSTSELLVDRSLNHKGSLFSHSFGAQNYSQQQQCQDLIVEVPCTLNELHHGASKVVTYSRKTLSADGQTTNLLSTKKRVNIKPGYSSNTKLFFPKEGHQSVHRFTSDLILQIKQVPQERSMRKDNHLFYIMDITLADALQCRTLEMTALDGRILKIGIDEILTPKILKEIEREGFIGPENQRGNLYIRFNIIFPQKLDESVRAQLRELLK